MRPFSLGERGDIVNSSRSASKRRRTAGVAVVGVLALATIAMPAAAHKGKGKPHHAGFKTSQAAMLDAAVPGATVTPLITVGETLPGSTYKFESIPDGIALRKGKGWKVEAYVNHETSTVPFPFTPGTPPTPGDRAQRLYERAPEQADAQPARRRGPRREVRDPERAELPALLLEHARVATRGLRAAAAVHERGGDRPRQPDGDRMASGPHPRAGGRRCCIMT